MTYFLAVFMENSLWDLRYLHLRQETVMISVSQSKTLNFPKEVVIILWLLVLYYIILYYIILYYIILYYIILYYIILYYIILYYIILYYIILYYIILYYIILYYIILYYIILYYIILYYIILYYIILYISKMVEEPHLISSLSYCLSFYPSQHLNSCTKIYLEKQ